MKKANLSLNSQEEARRRAELFEAAKAAKEVWDEIQKRQEERQLHELRTAARKISPA